jgi:hemerythrin-like domain-containing protein
MHIRLTSPAPQQVQHLSRKEAELFLKINQELSQKQRQRLDKLNEKIEEIALTEEKHAERLRLTDRVEKLWVGRCGH